MFKLWNVREWVILIVGIAIVTAFMFTLNAYVLDMTHGCYNLIDIALM